MCLGPGTPPAILKYSSDPGPSCWRKILDTCMHALSIEKIIKVQMHASISSGTFLYRPPPPPRSSSCLTTFTRVYYNTSAYMQHKVWISMNYILIPSFFPYQQRRGERALVGHVMYSVLDLGGIISRSPLWFCGKRTRNIPWRISRFRFPTKTKSKSVLYVLKNTMRLVTFGSNLPVYYG